MSQEEFVKNILEIPEETQTIEFKRLSGSKNEVGKIVETIVAMSNSDGGVVVLGIDDPEKTALKGFERIFGIEENLSNYDAIGREVQRIVPPLTGIWPPIEIFSEEVKKKIALLFVPKVADHFRAINNHVLIRQTKSNKLISPQETKCAIRVFQFTGTMETFKETPNLIGAPKTINGPVIKQIAETHEYVLTLLRSGIRIPSGFVTQYQLPERAVKEAITNAIIHRDYYIKKDIEIKIFEDRMEIESPGLFSYNITPANIGIVRADGYRNDLLVKHLREFPSPPNLDQNEGVRAMRNEMKAQGLYPPIFGTYPVLQNSVRVILLNEKVASEWEKVSFYLTEKKYITNEEARRVTGIVQRDKMAKLLKKWVNHGLLNQIVPPSGYVRGTKYRLPGTTEISK